MQVQQRMEMSPPEGNAKQTQKEKKRKNYTTMITKKDVLQFLSKIEN